MVNTLQVILFASSTALTTGLTAELTPHTAQISMQTNGSQLPMQGLAPYFTGPVRVEPLFQAHGDARAAGATVTFEPSSRTHWHTHPLGQTLVVTYGKGWVQQWQGQRLVIEPGDVIHIPANVKHWHGATDKTAMTHIAIQEAKEGSVVSWMEPVTQEQFLAPKESNE